jgi:thiol-disulfide isomerase/thioredoxin
MMRSTALKIVARARHIFCLVLAVSWPGLSSQAAHAAQQLEPWGGERAPPLVLKDLRGATHDLAKLRGKVVLVNFWATWCEPCRHEMPSIERLRDKLEGRPFSVLAVNVDEPHARVRNFLEQTALSLPVLMDQNKKVTRGWNVRVLPTTFVIGADGRIRYRLVGDIDWSHGSIVGIITRLLDGG